MIEKIDEENLLCKVMNMFFQKERCKGTAYVVSPFTNLYDCVIGEGCFIGPFVEMGGCILGKRTTISSHSYVCPGVEIGDDCFIAHGVQFTNDLFIDVPFYKDRNDLKKSWKQRPTKVGNRVRIGSGSVILPVILGDGCIIGAGSVVTKDVPPGETWCGNPVKMLYPQSTENQLPFGEWFQ